MSQQAPPYKDSTKVDLSGAPLADISFDDLFPPEGSVATPEKAQSETTPPPAPTPQASETPEDLFLKVDETGTVYKNKEEAIRGFAEKDKTIARLRAQYQEATGIDPLTGKQVGQSKATAQPKEPAAPNYSSDPQRFWNDIADAVEKKDPNAYAAVQRKFMQDQFAPIAPVLQAVAVRNAVDQAAAELPGFREMKSSPEFRQMLENLPLLKNAIDQSEQFLEAAPQLPELYRYAYMIHQGYKANEIVKQGVQVAPSAPQTSRPTITQSAMVPPTPAAPPDLSTSEGRKAIIERAQQSGGVASANWGERRW